MADWTDERVDGPTAEFVSPGNCKDDIAPTPEIVKADKIVFAWCQRKVKTLPKVYKMQRKSAPDELSWPDFIAMAPNPTLRGVECGPEAFYRLALVVFLCPVIFFGQTSINCPACALPDNVVTHGWATELRRVFCLAQMMFIFSRVFVCKNCPTLADGQVQTQLSITPCNNLVLQTKCPKTGKVLQNLSFRACSDDVMKQYPVWIRLQLPFVLTTYNGLEISLMEMITRNQVPVSQFSQLYSSALNDHSDIRTIIF